jgi:hypothetical protein
MGRRAPGSGASRWICAVSITLLAVAVALPAGDASAQTSKPLVEFVTPESGAAVTSSITVVLRAAQGARLRMNLGGHNVTRHFVRRGARTYVGRLTRSQIGAGPTSLAVIATRGRRREPRSIGLVGTTRQRGFVTVSLRKLARGAAPVNMTVRTRTPRVHLRVYLNGRSLGRRLIHGKLGVRRLQLTPEHGLRHGRNRLVVRAHDGRRHEDHFTRVFTIPRTGPLAGARHPRSVPLRGTAVFDAGPSHAASRNGRLTYRWRLLSRPKGSTAKLAGTTARRPRLRTDKPGPYRLRLEVTERRVTRRGARAAQQAPVAGFYEFDLSASPHAVVPAYGIGLQTLDFIGPDNIDEIFGVRLGQYEYPEKTGFDGAIQVLVINRLTGAAMANESITPVSGATPNIGRLADDMLNSTNELAGAGFGTIVVIRTARVTTYRPVVNAPTTSQLTQALTKYGVDNAQFVGQQIAGGWETSIVTVPGSSPGQAIYSVDPITDRHSDLTGYLRYGASQAGGPALTFTQADLVGFEFLDDTQPGTIDPAPELPAQTVPGLGPNDLRVSMFDATSLRLLTTVSKVGTDVSQVKALLNASGQDPTKLFVVRMYTPYITPDNSVIGPVLDVFDDLAAMGANRDLLNRTVPYQASNYGGPAWGGSTYTFIGGAGVQDVQGSSVQTLDQTLGGPLVVGSSRMKGYFTRNSQGRYEPRLAVQSTGPTNYDDQFQQLASTPPSTAWPTPDSSVDDSVWQAAEGRLFDLVIGSPSFSSSTAWPRGMRINYGNADFITKVASKDVQTALNCPATVNDILVGLPGEMPDGQVPYTQGQIDDLRHMICEELIYIKQIDDHMFTPMRAAVSQLETYSTLTVAGVSDEERSAIEAKAAEGVGVDSMSLASEFGYVASELLELASVPAGPEAPAALEASAPLLSMAASALGMSSEFGARDTTNETLSKIDAESSTLDTWVQQNYANALTGLNVLEGILVSDPAKLAPTTNNTTSNGVWDLTDETPATVYAAQLRSTATHYLWTQLVAAASSPSCHDIYQNTGTSNAMSYVAKTALGNGDRQSEGNAIYPFYTRIDTLNIPDSTANDLAGFMFRSAFDTGDLTQAPVGASIVRPDYFELALPKNPNSCTYTHN